METIKSCPKCNIILETVKSVDGDLLGYFCKGVLHKSCDYIDVKSSAEHEVEKKHKYIY